MHLIRFPTARLGGLLTPTEQPIKLTGAKSCKHRSAGIALLKLKEMNRIADPEKLQQQGHNAPPGGGLEPRRQLRKARVFRYRNSNQRAYTVTGTAAANCCSSCSVVARSMQASVTLWP